MKCNEETDLKVKPLVDFHILVKWKFGIRKINMARKRGRKRRERSLVHLTTSELVLESTWLHVAI